MSCVSAVFPIAMLVVCRERTGGDSGWNNYLPGLPEFPTTVGSLSMSEWIILVRRLTLDNEKEVAQ